MKDERNAGVNSSSVKADALAFVAARRICRQHAPGLFFASTFLPRPRREAAHAVYAFYRMIHEAIDEPAPAADACSTGDSVNQRMALFRDRLDEIYQAVPPPPDAPEFRGEQEHVLHAIAVTVHRYEIPKQHFLDLANGRAKDLAIARYATWNALGHYAYHASGVAALIASCICGVTHSDAGRHAIMLGEAIELTRILRDLKKDVASGRVYLPIEDLARFKYSERDLVAGVVNDPFRELMQFEITRARQMYQAGAEGICWLASDGSRLAASLVVVNHAAILDAIEQQGYDVFSKQACVTSKTLPSRLLRAWRLARRSADETLPRLFNV